MTDIIVMTMRFPATITVLCAMTVAGFPASGQTLEERGFLPVDQMIEDVDPLATSLRLQQPDFSLTGRHGRHTFRRTVPADPISGTPEQEKFFFIDHGVVAEFDRASYLMIFEEDKPPMALHLIPANTVFHIGLPNYEPVAPPPLPDAPELIDGRIDGEAESGDTGLVLMGLNQWRPLAPAAPQDEPLYQMRIDERVLDARRRGVMNAIDEAVAKLRGNATSRP